MEVRKQTHHQWVSLYDLDGLTPTEIADYMLQVKESFLQRGFQEPKLDVRIWGEYENDSKFESFRDETEQERTERLEKERQVREANILREKTLLEELKKKYENT